MEKLIIVDLNKDVCDAMEKAFAEFDDVEVVNGPFEDLEDYDCMVSAANSFGIMDGGVDGAITRYFGRGLMGRVQDRIIAEYSGEQPVGTSEIIRTGNDAHPWLAHTPTMRVPSDIRGTDNVYLAMKAMLDRVRGFNIDYEEFPEDQINIVACPGLGTLTGRLSPEDAAKQMALAYKNFKNPPTEITWEFATDRGNSVYDVV